MKLEQIMEYIKNPDKLLSVQDQEVVIDWATTWIYELEQDISTLDFQLDVKEAELTEKYGTSAKARTYLKLDPLYAERRNKELTLKALKSYRQNIRRKRDRVVPH